MPRRVGTTPRAHAPCAVPRYAGRTVCVEAARGDCSYLGSTTSRAVLRGGGPGPRAGLLFLAIRALPGLWCCPPALRGCGPAPVDLVDRPGPPQVGIVSCQVLVARVVDALGRGVHHRGITPKCSCLGSTASRVVMLMGAHSGARGTASHAEAPLSLRGSTCTIGLALLCGRPHSGVACGRTRM